MPVDAARPTPALIIEDITLERADRAVLSRLSLRADAGAVTKLVGPNGAGKTTLLRALAGLAEPVAGRIVLEGGGAEALSGERAEYAHYISHSNALRPEATVRENLAFWLGFLGGSGARGDADPADLIDAALATLGLTALEDVPTAYLSAGQKRRAGLARILVCPRPVWLLDEPTVGLDRRNVGVLSTLMRGHADRGGVVIIATHEDLPLAVDRVWDLAQVGRAHADRDDDTWMAPDAGDASEGGLSGITAAGETGAPA